MKKEKQMNEKRGRRWLLNGSMAAALVAAVAVFLVMLEMEKRVLADYEKGVIYVAAGEIPEGQLITEENFMEYFEKSMLDITCIPADAITETGQVTGLVARLKITEGTFLMKSMFEELDQITAKLKEPVVAGLRAEDLYQVVGGVLRVGDRIHILRVKEDGSAELVWENIFVQGVFDQAGNAIENDDEHTAAQRINVYIDKKMAPEFYSELTTGALRIVKVDE